MQIDTKVFDFHVRIITIVEGPYKGEVFILVQDVYRIAKGSALTRHAVEKTEHCTKEGVERIVGPNIVQMFKFSSYQTVSDRTNLMWLKFFTSYCCFNHLCTTNWN